MVKTGASDRQDYSISKTAHLKLYPHSKHQQELDTNETFFSRYVSRLAGTDDKPPRVGKPMSYSLFRGCPYNIHSSEGVLVNFFEEVNSRTWGKRIQTLSEAIIEFFSFFSFFLLAGACC